MAVLERISSIKNLTLIRIFRILRPLRTVERLGSLRNMLEIIIRSLILLFDSIAIILFYLVFLTLIMIFLS